MHYHRCYRPITRHRFVTVKDIEGHSSVTIAPSISCSDSSHCCMLELTFCLYLIQGGDQKCSLCLSSQSVMFSLASIPRTQAFCSGFCLAALEKNRRVRDQIRKAWVRGYVFSAWSAIIMMNYTFNIYRAGLPEHINTTQLYPPPPPPPKKTTKVLRTLVAPWPWLPGLP